MSFNPLVDSHAHDPVLTWFDLWGTHQTNKEQLDLHMTTFPNLVFEPPLNPNARIKRSRGQV